MFIKQLIIMPGYWLGDYEECMEYIRQFLTLNELSLTAIYDLDKDLEGLICIEVCKEYDPFVMGIYNQNTADKLGY